MGGTKRSFLPFLDGSGKPQTDSLPCNPDPIAVSDAVKWCEEFKKSLINNQIYGTNNSNNHNVSISGSISRGINFDLNGDFAQTTKKVYQKKNVGEDQNRVVRLASIISNNDFDWIKTLNRENGLWTMYRKHPNRNRDGSWDYACGLNSYYHMPFIKKIKAKTVTEEDILRYCYDVYKKRPTAFYGYKTRNKDSNQFYLTNL